MEKQIEEMQKIMEHCCNVYDDKGKHIRNKCNTHDCEYYCDTNNVCCSFSLKEAKALYNAGYRKIDEGSIVWTKAEHEEIMQSLQRTLTNATLLKCIIKQKEEEASQARKETAKEILERFYKQLVAYNYGGDYYTDTEINKTIQYLEKLYGVEIEL